MTEFLNSAVQNSEQRATAASLFALLLTIQNQTSFFVIVDEAGHD